MQGACLQLHVLVYYRTQRHHLPLSTVYRWLKRGYPSSMFEFSRIQQYYAGSTPSFFIHILDTTHVSHIKYIGEVTISTAQYTYGICTLALMKEG